MRQPEVPVSKAPLRFGDTAEIEMTVGALGARSVTFHYRIFRAVDDAGGERELAAEGSNTCAVVDLTRFQAVPIPDHIRALFSALADGGGV